MSCHVDDHLVCVADPVEPVVILFRRGGHRSFAAVNIPRVRLPPCLFSVLRCVALEHNERRREMMVESYRSTGIRTKGRHNLRISQRLHTFIPLVRIVNTTTALC
jgi:hypothetical protein